MYSSVICGITIRPGSAMHTIPAFRRISNSPFSLTGSKLETADRSADEQPHSPSTLSAGVRKTTHRIHLEMTVLRWSCALFPPTNCPQFLCLTSGVQFTRLSPYFPKFSVKVVRHRVGLWKRFAHQGSFIASDARKTDRADSLRDNVPLLEAIGQA
jgi:hypothetical protein